MQIVKWGKKQKQVKVPVGWRFLKNGQRVELRDKFFNVLAHIWDDVRPEDCGLIVGAAGAGIVIRRDIFSEANQVDKDVRAVRMVEQMGYNEKSKNGIRLEE